MSARGRGTWGRANSHLVTFRTEATYRLGDDRLVIPAGTQLVGMLTETPDPALHLPTMALALSPHLADTQPNPDTALTLAALARQTAQAAAAAQQAGDDRAAADRFLQAAVQQRLLGNETAAAEHYRVAQRARNRFARTPEGLADFDRHTGELSDEALRQLGATIRLAVRQLGGYRYTPPTAVEAAVIWEVVRHAVAQIANHDSWNRQHPRPVLPITPETMWVDGEALVGELLTEPSGPPERLTALAEVSIALDPDDADGYILLGQQAAERGGVEEARGWYEAGVRAGERKLGAAFFTDPDRPRFWLAVETRPYMRARAMLADALARLGQPQQAIAEYWGMLALNPGDNQGIRYILASLLLEQHDLAGVERLYREIATPLDDGDAPEDDAGWGGLLDDGLSDDDLVGDDGGGGDALGDAPAGTAPDPLDPTQLNPYEGAMWLYPAALYHYLRDSDGERARQVLALARTQNPYVIPLLTGRGRPPRDTPSSYSPGSRDEAVIYARHGRRAWEQAPGALDWLRRESAPKPPSPKRTTPAAPPGVRRAVADTPLRDLLATWVADPATLQAPATKKVYRATLTRLVDELEAHGGPATGAALTADAVTIFLAGVEPARRSQARNSIRVWADWLQQQGAIRRNPIRG